MPVMVYLYFADTFSRRRKRTLMCPPAVGITNSPNVEGKRKMFLLSGRMGPPLRRTAKKGRNCPTHFVI